jgi:hypothetical protein
VVVSLVVTNIGGEEKLLLPPCFFGTLDWNASIPETKKDTRKHVDSVECFMISIYTIGRNASGSC